MNTSITFPGADIFGSGHVHAPIAYRVALPLSWTYTAISFLPFKGRASRPTFVTALLPCQFPQPSPHSALVRTSTLCHRFLSPQSAEVCLVVWGIGGVAESTIGKHRVCSAHAQRCGTRAFRTSSERPSARQSVTAPLLATLLHRAFAIQAALSTAPVVRVSDLTALFSP